MNMTIVDRTRLALDGLQACTILGPYPAHSPDWHEARKLGLGGSDAGAILGLNKYSSPLQVWEQKTGRGKPFEGNAATRYGQAREGFLREQFGPYYAALTGFEPEVLDPSGYMARSKKWPFMQASLDGLFFDENGELCLLEIKTGNAQQLSKWEGAQVPDSYFAQVQHYLAVLGLSKAFVFAEIGGDDPFHRVILRSEDFTSKLVSAEASFWEKVVLDEPPLAEAGDGEALKDLFPVAGETIIEAPELEESLTELKGVKDQLKHLEAREKELESLVKQRIGEGLGVSAGGLVATWSNRSSNRFDSTKFKSAYPQLAAEFTTESTTRVFALKEKK